MKYKSKIKTFERPDYTWAIWFVMTSLILPSLYLSITLQSIMNAIANLVSKGLGTAIKTGSPRQFKRYPTTTYLWVWNWLPTSDYLRLILVYPNPHQWLLTWNLQIRLWVLFDFVLLFSMILFSWHCQNLSWLRLAFTIDWSVRAPGGDNTNWHKNKC